LRNTAAARGWGHPKVVQERLGHAAIAITLDTYSHVAEEMQREATRRLDILLGS
jgi:integrase